MGETGLYFNSITVHNCYMHFAFKAPGGVEVERVLQDDFGPLPKAGPNHGVQGALKSHNGVTV